MTDLTLFIDGLVLGESPRWHDGRLWLSDWGAHEVLAINLEGGCEVITHVPSLPFSIDWLPDGRLLIVHDGLLVCQESDGSFAPYADLREISAYPWNEIVVDGRGNVYVNNIGFDMMGGEEPSMGSVTLVLPDGTAKQVADGVQFPNGMAVTPDNSTLILAESYGKRLTAFEIGEDGTLSRGRIWADLIDGVPDGICVDSEGAVWYADVSNKRCARVREGGEVLQSLQADRGCFACMLGGQDDQTIFVVAAEWKGPESIASAERTGVILAAAAPAPRAGWP